MRGHQEKRAWSKVGWGRGLSTRRHGANTSQRRLVGRQTRSVPAQLRLRPGFLPGGSPATSHARSLQREQWQQQQQRQGACQGPARRGSRGQVAARGPSGGTQDHPLTHDQGGEVDEGRDAMPLAKLLGQRLDLVCSSIWGNTCKRAATCGNEGYSTAWEGLWPCLVARQMG